MRHKTFSKARIAFFAALLSATGALLAQYQVNNQIYGNSAPPPRLANTTPGTTNYVSNSSNWLPSEARNETFKSGLTPSQLRYNYSQVGPLAPNAQSYIYPNGTPAPQQGVDSRIGAQDGVTAPRPTPQITNSPRAIQPQRINSGTPLSAPTAAGTGTSHVQYNPPGLKNSNYNSSGSIRYGQ